MGKREQAQVQQRLARPSARVCAPSAAKAQISSAPARRRTGSARSRTVRSASCAGAASPSCSPAARRVTSSPSPSAESTLPTQSSRRLRAGRGRSSISAEAGEDPAATTTSPGEDDPPAELGRRPAAEDRPDRDAAPGDAAEHAVGDRALLAARSWTATRATIAGSTRRCADPLEHRPAERQRGDVPGRRRSGPSPRRRCSSRSGTRGAPSRSPSLPPVSISAGHHQRVERDHRLDRRDRGVEVGDELRDRDVHHRLVEDHQELRRCQDDQDPPFRHRPSLWLPAAAGATTGENARDGGALRSPLRGGAGRIRREPRRGDRRRCRGERRRRGPWSTWPAAGPTLRARGRGDRTRSSTCSAPARRSSR